jgi:hypothetical protein
VRDHQFREAEEARAFAESVQSPLRALCRRVWRWHVGEQAYFPPDYFNLEQIHAGRD